VGRELGVRAIFEGRVTQRGNNLAISAELIDARTNDHLWGQQYNQKLADVVTLQEEIPKEMTTALRMHLTGDDEKRMAKTYTASPEAYQLYLQGRYWWNKRSEEGFNKGISYFLQAIAKDPTYALAYAGLADCYTFLAVYGFAPPKEAFPKAKDAAQKALDIDNTLAEGHGSQVYIKLAFDWDWSGADREFQRAMELNPSYATIHRWRGDAFAVQGRLEESIAEDQQALALDPLSHLTVWTMGYDFYSTRQYDRAIEQYRKSLEMDPNFVFAHAALGEAYLQKSMYNEGIAECEKAIEILPGNARALSCLGYAYAVAGRRTQAQRVLDQLNEIAKHRYLPPAYRATVYAGLGEKDKAFEWLEKAYDDRSLANGMFSIKVDPIFDPLHSDPRFAALLRRMNLQP
jgi:tetratricopeptide (TPR) repeat protein